MVQATLGSRSHSPGTRWTVLPPSSKAEWSLGVSGQMVGSMVLLVVVVGNQLIRADSANGTLLARIGSGTGPGGHHSVRILFVTSGCGVGSRGPGFWGEEHAARREAPGHV